MYQCLFVLVVVLFITFSLIQKFYNQNCYCTQNYIPKTYLYICWIYSIFSHLEKDTFQTIFKHQIINKGKSFYFFIFNDFTKLIVSVLFSFLVIGLFYILFLIRTVSYQNCYRNHNYISKIFLHNFQIKSKFSHFKTPKH